MALTKEDIVKILDDSKIKYEIVEHKPVYTIDEMLECNLPHPEQIAKNLFVRDDKKRKYYPRTRVRSHLLLKRTSWTRWG